MAGVITYESKGSGGVRDALWTFDAGTAIAYGNTGTNVATDVLDLGADAADDISPRDLGTGTPVRFAFLCAVSSDGATDSETVQFQVATSDAANLASAAVVATTPAIAQAGLVAGTKYQLTIPENIRLDRYVGVQVVVGGENTSAGTYFASVEGN